MVKRCGKLKRDDPDAKSIEHRQAKYLNNRIEADHGPIKRLCRATLGFESMKTAYATIKGFEVMRMIRKRQCILSEPGVTGEVRFVNKCSSISPPDPGCGASQIPSERGQCKMVQPGNILYNNSEFLTKLLEQVFSEISRLPEEDQDVIAQALMELIPNAAVDLEWERLTQDPRP